MQESSRHPLQAASAGTAQHPPPRLSASYTSTHKHPHQQVKPVGSPPLAPIAPGTHRPWHPSPQHPPPSLESCAAPGSRSCCGGRSLLGAHHPPPPPLPAAPEARERALGTAGVGRWRGLAGRQAGRRGRSGALERVSTCLRLGAALHAASRYASMCTNMCEHDNDKHPKIHSSTHCCR